MPSVWSASDAAASDMTLSNGGLTVTPTVTSWNSVRGTISKTTGKLYFEVAASVAPTNPANNVGVGLANAGFPVVAGNYLGSLPVSGAAYLFASQFGAGVTWNYGFLNAPVLVGDVLGVAIDLDAGKGWVAYNGAWRGSGNPATGANPAFTYTPASTGAVFPGMSLGDPNAGSWTLQPAAASQKYAPPSGFTAWDLASANKTIFITSGATWTVPSDCTSAVIEAFGAGGGGGGANGPTTAGAGGGGGEYRKATGVPLTPLASIPVQIGQGGVGGGNNINGTAGAATTFNTSTVVANGGGGGLSSGTTGGGAGGSGGTGAAANNNGGAGGNNLQAGYGGAGGGGAGGVHAVGGAGGQGAQVSGALGAGGGGGADNGATGVGAITTSFNGAAGGPSFTAAGGAAGSGSAGPVAGTSGSGGGGAAGGSAGTSSTGAAGGPGVGWTQTSNSAVAGPGGGGGGGGGDIASPGGFGGVGGFCGGGGGGGASPSSGTGGTGGNGANGIIVVTYTPVVGGASAQARVMVMA